MRLLDFFDLPNPFILTMTRKDDNLTAT
jgi:hypothetical protein